MEIKQIKQEIKDILTGQTGPLAADLFSVTYGYPKPSPDSFPSARVYTTSGGSQTMQTYTQNLAEMRFVVDCTFIYDDSEGSYNTMLDIFDLLMVEINRQSNYTLSGEAEYVLADEFEFYYPQSMDSQKYMGFIIQITVRSLTNNV